MKRLLVLAAVLTLTAFAAACGGTVPEPAADPAGGGSEPPATTDTSEPPATTDSSEPAIPYSNDPTTVLVDVTSGGGFVPASVAVDQRPTLRLYGDGTVLVMPGGETTVGGFPALDTYRLTEEGIAEVLAAADRAGLLAEAPDYGQPPVTDLPTTVVTIDVDAGSFQHGAYALGFDDDAGVSAEQTEARQRLTAFIDEVAGLATSRPELLASEPAPYEPVAVDVYAWVYDGEISPEVVTADWPAQPPLSEYEAQDHFGAGCATLEGADVAALRDALSGKDAFVVWQSGTKSWTVGLDLVLPGETGCSTGS
jgi:hypothetical protein